MKKLLYIFLFFTICGFSQATVGIKKMVEFADHTESIKGAFHIFRHTALSTSLDVTYTVSGGGASYVDLVNGTATIPAYSQVVLIEFSTTSNPATDQTLTITVTDNSNPDYDLEARTSTDIIITSRTPLPAFEGAEGAAKYAGSRVSENSHRGGDVYKVTNLNNSGAGSRTQAYFDANSNGGGYVIYDIGGEIEKTGRDNFSNYNGIYDAGQTAPGDGILVSGYNSTSGILSATNADNLIIRYIHFLHGRELTGGSIDAVSFFNCRNIYVNHFAVDYGDDELMSATNTDYTITHGWITFDYGQWGQAFYDYSPFKTHNTGSLMGALGSADVKRQTAITLFSWNKNVTHNTGHRVPGNASGYGHFEAINNVIGNHDYRLSQIAYPQPKYNWIGNFIQPGNFTNNIADAPFSSSQYFEGGNLFSRTSYTFDDKAMGLMYADGNVLNGYIAESDDDWLFNTYFFDVAYLYDPFPKTNQLSTPVDTYYTTEIETAQNAFTALTGAGGAGVSKRLEADGTVTLRRNTWYQDKIDEVNSGVFTDYVDVADWDTEKPTFSIVTRPVGYDTDNDGMPNTWEVANGLDPNVYNPNRQGIALHPYKDNLEVFLDEVADSETPTPNAPVYSNVSGSKKGFIKNQKILINY